MTRRDILRGTLSSAAAALTGGLAKAAPPATAAQTRPNIVFFFVDDLGWGDLGCYGSGHHRTPHIDRLAREAMLFTQAYAGAAPNLRF